MSKTQINFGIIGLGSIANHHIKSIIESKFCNLIAVCSRNETKLLEAKAKYNFITFTDYQKMLELDNIDVVIICTPSGYHLEPALAAAKREKHILVEKPLEVTLERAQKMIDACKKANVSLGCVFQNRYTLNYKKIKEAVKNGAIGKIILGNAYIKWNRDQAYYEASNWRGTLKGDGGAALINQSIHTIDLLLDVMGPVKSVFGKVKTITHNIEGEDIGTAILEFKNGAIGTIEGSTAIYSGYPEKLEIHGEKGNFILEGGEIVQWQCLEENINFDEKLKAKKTGASDPMAINYLNHKRQIEDFTKSILFKQPIAIDGEESLKSLRVIMAIYESSKTGKQIIL